MTLMELLQKSTAIIEEQAAKKGLTDADAFDILLIVVAIDETKGDGVIMASTNTSPPHAKKMAEYFADTVGDPCQTYEDGPVKVN